MDLNTAIQTYFIVHGVSTIGALMVFLIRTENRITKLETSLNNLKESHDILTDHGRGVHI